jgi:hypothetical protein
MKWNQVWTGLLRHGAEDFFARRDEASRTADAPRVLVATGTAGYALGALVESSLAVALTLRGAKVDFLICDGALPACQQSDFGDLLADRASSQWPQPRCEKCYTQGSQCYAPLGLDVLRYSDFLDAEARDWAHAQAASVPVTAIPAFELDGLKVGEHAHAGALRYFARADLANEGRSEAVLRAYFKAALLTTRCVQRLLEERQYSVACFHHGIYVPQGLVGEVCRSRGVRVVNWNPAYRDHSFIFSHGDSYHHTMISEPVETWQDLDLTPARQLEIEQYLEDRRTGRGDWIWFLHSGADGGGRDALAGVGVDRQRPFVTLLTSVMWDAQLHYESNAFDSMLDWIFETIAYFGAHPDRQLVIRIHPAEITGNIASRQRVVDEVAARFAALPPNVFIVPPDDPLSTYELIDASQAVLVYNTKTGIEIASRGIQVVVAGEAWIRSKGFSLDASSREEYLRILDGLPAVGRLTAAARTRALKYAYHFFFRRMIPLSFVHSRERFKFELSLTGLRDLLPGREPGLDCICDGILDGAPFVFDAPVRTMAL